MIGLGVGEASSARFSVEHSGGTEISKLTASTHIVPLSEMPALSGR
jgi:hypothetical protein